jgi:hypothetical protein
MAAISPLFRTLLVAVPMLMTFAVPASAQIASTKPYASLFLVRDAGAVTVPEATNAVPLVPALTTDTQVPVPAISREAPAAVKSGLPRSLQPALYGGLIVLQGLDVHSTLRAIDAGHYEQNPVMRWSVEHPAALISMKAAASAATIYVAEKIRKRYPKRALLFMAAVNSAYAFVVVHNYKVPVY